MQEVVRKENRLDRDGDEERKREGKGRRSERREEKKRFLLSELTHFPQGPPAVRKSPCVTLGPVSMVAPAAPAPGATPAPALQATLGPTAKPALTTVPLVSAPHVLGLGQKRMEDLGRVCLCHIIKRKKKSGHSKLVF